MRTSNTTANAALTCFLGNAPVEYKAAILGFLLLNPLLLWLSGPVITGWALIFEFIFTLAMALKCYPLQPGGLLAIEAVLIGLTEPERVYVEITHNLPVILLLMFMVAAIYFMKGMLLFLFTKLLLHVRHKRTLALLFTLTGALLSAFLDALTVTAVLISAAVGFYAVYHRVASGRHHHDEHDHSNDDHLHDDHREELEQFRGFLRSLLMHGAVGTALGGVCTLVGEPQNLLIGQRMGWDFGTFFRHVAPVAIPVVGAGLVTTWLLERYALFGYGEQMPQRVYEILREFDLLQREQRTATDRFMLAVQFLAALFLVTGLALHLAEVGIIGLVVIILITSFSGIVEEHQIGRAFQDGLPFTALLVVFFTIVAVIHDQHLFTPMIEWVLTLDARLQPAMFFAANGLLSAISDNVFVATVYISEVEQAHQAGLLTREQLETLAVAINTGTNLPSVATPNGQAAFLFLLTSVVAPLVRLSYLRMVYMALPYTLVLSVTGLLAVVVLL